MSRTLSPSTGRRYGVRMTAEALGVARSTVYAARSRQRSPKPPAKRGPRTKYSDEQLLDAIRRDLAESPFNGEGHRKVWARLRHAGVRTSKARLLRLMGEARLTAPFRQVRARSPQSRWNDHS